MTHDPLGDLNELQAAVLGILYEHQGRSGMEAAKIGERLMDAGLIDHAWGRVGTQAGGRGQRFARDSGGPKRATRSAQKTLLTLRQVGYVTASEGSVLRYKLSAKGQQAWEALAE